MSLTLDNIEPQIVFQEFYNLCKIPRGSGNEKQVSLYLKERLESWGYKVQQDKYGDIKAIRKADDPNCKLSVCLQGHMDMVCSKRADTKHDFLKDPIVPRIQKVDGEDCIVATGTTLGADDGMGVATILALFSEGRQKQNWPQLELLFTVNEEQLMTGAMAVGDVEKPVEAPIYFPEGTHIKLESKYILNLDSEEINVITISSAGGQNSNFKLDNFQTEKVEGKKFLSIKVSNCNGGHSGCDANKYTASAIKQLFRILALIQEKIELQVISAIGGTAHNAIAMDCEYKCACKPENVEEIKAMVSKLGQEIVAEFKTTDPHMTITCEEIQMENAIACTVAETQRLTDFVTLLPTGVFRFSQEIKGLVESTSSLGVLHFVAGDKESKALALARSGQNCELPNIDMQYKQLARVLNINYNGMQDDYLGWVTVPTHDLVLTSQELYAKACGCKKEDITIEAICAGLECGQLIANNSSAEAAISIGCTVRNPHSDRELCQINTVEPVYKMVKMILEHYGKQ